MAKAKHDSTILKQFRAVSRSYSDKSILMHEAIARKAGLAGTDHKYLGLIIENKRITAGEIAKQTGLTTGSVTALIDRLEKKKLIKREFSKEDRRKVFIVPNTQMAMKLMEPLFTELQNKTGELLSTFSVNELKVVERYFQSAVAIMESVTHNLNKK
jgi:DNA-binding MarR family transcriptional regulator